MVEIDTCSGYFEAIYVKMFLYFSSMRKSLGNRKKLAMKIWNVF